MPVPDLVQPLVLLAAVAALTPPLGSYIARVMGGRTPEWLGRKIQAREVKLAGLAILVMPALVLVLTGIAAVVPAGSSSRLNLGPHGLTEILYAFTSMANNNGSAFAGLTGNTAFCNLTGSLALFVSLLVGVVVVVGALTFFPVLALAPIVEQLLQGTGQLF
jgi:potassium-transporting ATPase potassium-binding subunit